ncbi:MAG: PKD domain-containing protein [Thermodesulfobacteriota bacterium]
MGYFEDNDGDSIYTAGIDTLVDEYGSRLDAGGVSTYTKATNPIKPRLKAAVDFNTLFSFGDPAVPADLDAFVKKADMTAAGQMRDCAECHVGGGAMQYLPVAPGTSLSNGTCQSTQVYRGVTYTNNSGMAGQPCTSTDVEGYCGTYQYNTETHYFTCTPNDPRQELRTASFPNTINSFNFFIDQYDEDNDGILGEAIAQDYSQTGVLEMDCLMCHMEGYAYEERNEAVRKGKFDASRVVGAEIGTPISGTTVAYDPAMVGISSGNLTLGVAGSHLHGIPSENCANCHADMHAVDWKKRGDSWGVPYEADVHGALECVSCHAKKDDSVYGGGAWRQYDDLKFLDGKSSSTFTGHDPAKGNAPYSSLWNKNDNSMKNCQDCHSATPTGENYGAIDPTPKHAALGLTSMILQTGVDGTRNASHLDILDCSTCHVRKLGHGPTAAEGGDTHGSLYEWGTGGAMVDLSGPDAEGRVTDHENLYVERSMENNLALAWQGGKLIKTNSLISMFWRDKNDSTVDINADGQMGGMDQVNPSHVRDAMAAAGLSAMTQDGVIDTTEIAAQRVALLSYLPTVGIDVTGANLQLSFMGVMFKVNHNVSPAAEAWGKGGCTDCHGADKGFYNGLYAVKPRDLTISYASADRTPFTKVNTTEAGGVASDFHPTLFAKSSQGNGRSIALNVSAGTTLRDMDLSEALWESTLRVPIQTTQAGVVTTRAQYVDYLNTRVNSVHNRHVAAGYGKCSNCHYSATGAGNIDYTTVSDAGQPLDKNGVVSTFTYTPGPMGAAGSCASNSCHASWGFSTENPWIRPSFTPFLSALSSMDTNLEVELNASRTTCPNGCEYTFDAGDAGATVIVNGAIATVTYPAAGDYTASVIACDSVTDECYEAEATATAQIVEPEVLDAGFTSAVTGKTVTLTGSALDAGIVRAYIYWGDRKSSQVTPAQLAAGVAHTYTLGGKTYDISVKVMAADYSQTTYTVADDGDLQIVLP